MPKGATVRNALDVAAELRQEVRDGADQRRRMPNVRDYSETYCMRKVSRAEWTKGSTTSDTAVSVLKNQIWPSLGDLLLDRLTVEDLRVWMDDQVRSGAAAGTIAQRWKLLGAIVRSACAEYGLSDITPAVSAPKVSSKGGRDLVLLPNQLRALLVFVREKEARWYPHFVVGFASGARVGEVVAAQVGDFELAGDVGVWTISRHVGRHQMVVEGSKTGPGRVAYLRLSTNYQPGISGQVAAHRYCVFRAG